MAREIEVRAIHPPWDRAHDSYSVTEARLNLATAARVNIYALPGPLGFGMAVGASLMFLGALRGMWSGRLRLSRSILEAPDFQRKPVAEMLGIAVAIEVAKQYGWDGRGPQSVDALRQYWGKDGQRPDLLFTQEGSGLQFVGEAKGRITTSGVMPGSAPQYEEREWLRSLASWYKDLGLQYFLAAAHGSISQVRAHLFDPGEPRLVYPPEALTAAIRSREDMLLRTAPPDGLELQNGRLLRGIWRTVPSEPDTEEDASQMFLGVVEGAPLTAPFELETPTELVSSSGRVVVVLRRGSAEPSERLGPAEAAASHPELASQFRIARRGRPIAWGRASSSGFLVAAGSFAREPQSSLPSSDHALRRRLLRAGVLSVLDLHSSSSTPASCVFRADHEFISAGQAARIVLGTNAGSGEWRPEVVEP